MQVKKKSGIIIKPIKFQEVDPHEKTEEHRDQKKGGNNQKKTNKRKSGGGRRAGVKAVVVKS